MSNEDPDGCNAGLITGEVMVSATEGWEKTKLEN